MNKRFSMRLMAVFFSVGTLCSMMHATVQPPQNAPITYKEVGDAYINSFGIVEAQKESANTDSDKKEKKKLDLSIPTLSEHEKSQRLFGIQARNEKPQAVDPLINEALRVTLKDIDVYYGSGRDPKKTLMNEFDCNTIFGEAELAYLFAHPFCDIKTLQKRQALIKELVENEELFNTVSSILEMLKKQNLDSSRIGSLMIR